MDGRSSLAFHLHQHAVREHLNNIDENAAREL